jgi:hypothetical protein
MGYAVDCDGVMLHYEVCCGLVLRFWLLVLDGCSVHILDRT